MKIFFALILLLVALIGLVDGTPFKGRIEKIKKRAAEFKRDYLIEDVNEYNEDIAKLSLPLVIGAGFIMIIEVLFYFMVVNIAGLTLPTIVMMSLFIAGIFMSIRKVADDNKDKKIELHGMERVRKEFDAADKLVNTKTRTVSGTLTYITKLIYIVYALLILI